MIAQSERCTKSMTAHGRSRETLLFVTHLRRGTLGTCSCVYCQRVKVHAPCGCNCRFVDTFNDPLKFSIRYFVHILYPPSTTNLIIGCRVVSEDAKELGFLVLKPRRYRGTPDARHVLAHTKDRMFRPEATVHVQGTFVLYARTPRIKLRFRFERNSIKVYAAPLVPDGSISESDSDSLLSLLPWSSLSSSSSTICCSTLLSNRSKTNRHAGRRK